MSSNGDDVLRGKENTLPTNFIMKTPERSTSSPEDVFFTPAAPVSRKNDRVSLTPKRRPLSEESLSECSEVTDAVDRLRQNFNRDLATLPSDSLASLERQWKSPQKKPHNLPDFSGSRQSIPLAKSASYNEYTESARRSLPSGNDAPNEDSSASTSNFDKKPPADPSRRQMRGSKSRAMSPANDMIVEAQLDVTSHAEMSGSHSLTPNSSKRSIVEVNSPIANSDKSSRCRNEDRTSLTSSLRQSVDGVSNAGLSRAHALGAQLDANISYIEKTDKLIAKMDKSFDDYTTLNSDLEKIQLADVSLPDFDLVPQMRRSKTSSVGEPEGQSPHQREFRTVVSDIVSAPKKKTEEIVKSSVSLPVNLKKDLQRRTNAVNKYKKAVVDMRKTKLAHCSLVDRFSVGLPDMAKPKDFFKTIRMDADAKIAKSEKLEKSGMPTDELCALLKKKSEKINEETKFTVAACQTIANFVNTFGEHPKLKPITSGSKDIAGDTSLRANDSRGPLPTIDESHLEHEESSRSSSVHQKTSESASFIMADLVEDDKIAAEVAETSETSKAENVEDSNEAVDLAEAVKLSVTDGTQLSLESAQPADQSEGQGKVPPLDLSSLNISTLNNSNQLNVSARSDVPVEFDQTADVSDWFDQSYRLSGAGLKQTKKALTEVSSNSPRIVQTENKATTVDTAADRYKLDMSDLDVTELDTSQRSSDASRRRSLERYTERFPASPHQENKKECVTENSEVADSAKPEESLAVVEPTAVSPKKEEKSAGTISSIEDLNLLDDSNADFFDRPIPEINVIPPDTDRLQQWIELMQYGEWRSIILKEVANYVWHQKELTGGVANPNSTDRYDLQLPDEFISNGIPREILLADEAKKKIIEDERQALLFDALHIAADLWPLPPRNLKSLSASKYSRRKNPEELTCSEFFDICREHLLNDVWRRQEPGGIEPSIVERTSRNHDWAVDDTRRVAHEIVVEDHDDFLREEIKDSKAELEEMLEKGCTEFLFGQAMDAQLQTARESLTSVRSSLAEPVPTPAVNNSPIDDL